jgi:signal transduction histidine kinase
MALSAQISRQIVQELYEIAPCGFLSTLDDGTIIKVNHTFLEWTKYTEEELLSAKRFQDLLPAPGKIFYETQFAPLLQMQGIVKEVAFDLLCRNRDPLPVLVNSVRRKPEDGLVLIHSAFFDATDRRKYELNLLRARQRLELEASQRTAELEKEIQERKRIADDLRELTARLLRLRDEEQRRLARELHDSVGQLLVALSMNQSQILNDPHISPAIQGLIEQNVSFVSHLSTEIRTISHLLHPPLLDEVGLRSALKDFIDGFSERSKLAVELKISEDLPRLQRDVETALFRIVQECLTNIYRHSGSRSASVEVAYDALQIRLEVRDFGTGTAPEAMHHIKSGVGLRGMRERVRELGGTIDVTSAEPGIRVIALFPSRERRHIPIDGSPR